MRRNVYIINIRDHWLTLVCKFGCAYTEIAHSNNIYWELQELFWDLLTWIAKSSNSWTWKSNSERVERGDRKCGILKRRLNLKKYPIICDWFIKFNGRLVKFWTEIWKTLIKYPILYYKYIIVYKTRKSLHY